MVRYAGYHEIMNIFPLLIFKLSLKVYFSFIDEEFTKRREKNKEI